MLISRRAEATTAARIQPRGSVWYAIVAWLLMLNVAQFAQAGPSPVKPIPAKPTAIPAKPTATPAKPTATPAKPDSQPVVKTPVETSLDPFASGVDTPSTNNANVRHSELYGDRLDDLQAEVDELKDKIFRSKARLTLLKETVLRGALSGSRVTIAHQNLMGSGFRLVRVVFDLDGAQVRAETDDTGRLDREDEFLVYDGNLPPGPHTIAVELTYQGNGYGIFAYLNGYTFESRSSYRFTAPDSGAIKIVSQGFERGNMTTEMNDRPAVKWQEIPLDASGRPTPVAGPKPTAAKKGAS